MCGWCYAAEPLVSAVVAQLGNDLTFALHGGGLFPQPTTLSAIYRRHIVEADRRIAALSGQTFSSAYFDGLLADPATVYDSTKPMAAILAATEIDLMRALQL